MALLVPTSFLVPFWFCQLQLDPDEDSRCALPVDFHESYLKLNNTICWTSPQRFCVPDAICPFCLAPVGPYLVMCQSVFRTCPSRRKWLCIGNTKEGSPKQCCLAGSYEVWVFKCEEQTGCRYAEKLGCKSFYLLLFNSVLNGLYIKEATKVICTGSDPALLGAGLLRKRRGGK